MPWKVSGVVEQRARFVLEYALGEVSMAELCRAYGICRKTGYKIWARYEAGGLEALKDRSRAPHEHPNAIPVLSLAGKGAWQKAIFVGCSGQFV